MSASVDSSEVGRLATDLANADRRITPAMRSVVKRGALSIKRGMQRDFAGHRYAGAVPGSLEFEMAGNAAYSQATVGEIDSAGPQWGLAGILAYGTSNNAPVVDHTAALRKEAPIAAKYLADAGEDSVLGGP